MSKYRGLEQSKTSILSTEKTKQNKTQTPWTSHTLLELVQAAFSMLLYYIFYPHGVPLKLDCAVDFPSHTYGMRQI